MDKTNASGYWLPADKIFRIWVLCGFSLSLLKIIRCTTPSLYAI